jgi:uncharacterized protein (DUF1330 family)
MIRDFKRYVESNIYSDKNIPLYVTDEFSSILKNIDDGISHYIQDKIGEFFKYSTITISNNINMIRCLNYDIIIKTLNIKEENIVKGSFAYWFNNYRTIIKNFNNVFIEMKIGKFIKYITGDRFKDHEIENFVNKYKSILDYNEYDFHIVKGTDMIKWYNEKSYVEGGGSLNSSCMRYGYCSKYLELYCDNPDVVSLVICKKPGTELIYGRALLWKLQEPRDMYFMDRIYTCEDYMIQKFKRFASDRNWLTKNRQNTDEEIYDKNDNLLTLVVNIKNKQYYTYPYMDTLKFYIRFENVLTNKNVLEDYDDLKVYLLTSTTGSFSTLDSEFVYDEYNQEYINNDIAVYCERQDVYCNERDVILVQYKHDGKRVNFYATPDYDEIVFSSYNNMYILKDDAVKIDYKEYVLSTDVIFSDYYGKYIIKDDSKEVIDEDDKLDYVDKTDAIFSNYYGNYIIKYLSVEVSDKNNKLDYVYKTDAIFSDYYDNYIIKEYSQIVIDENGKTQTVYEKDMNNI